MNLEGRVALVTGASRGIGRGIAQGLGEAGATVYITGRTLEALQETAALVSDAGGQGIAMACDHADDSQVAGVFDAIRARQGRLDILVNNATTLPDQKFLFSETPFWDVPASAWDGLMNVGVRSAFVASGLAAPLMLAQGSGLIVNISSAGAKQKFAILPYGVAKAALDRATADMAADLGDRGVTVTSVWPPPTSTESMLAAAEPGDDRSQWSLPVFTGRVIAALATSPGIATRAGGAHRVRDLAVELGVRDVRYRGSEGSVGP